MKDLTTTEIRIEGCIKNIDKTRNTLERHKKTLEKKLVACTKLGVDPENCDKYDRSKVSGDAYWAVCEYEHVKESIKDNEKKLQEYSEKLSIWRQKKAAEDKRTAELPVVPAVEEFLARWRESAEEYARAQVAELKKWVDEYNSYYKEQMEELEKMFGYRIHFGRDKEVVEERTKRRVNPEYKREYLKTKFTQDIILASTLNDSELDFYLKRELDTEMCRKRIDLYERCSAVVGVIKDASGLRTGNNGTINGLVIGENGSAHVETILAGGYHIQCLHYRVLVNKVTEPKKVAAKKPVDVTQTQPKAPEIKKKSSDNKGSKYKGMSLQELKEMAKNTNADCKVYEDEKIYKMRLIMAIKKALGE